MQSRRLVLTAAALVLASGLLAGCLADDPGDPEPASASDADPADEPPAAVERLSDGRLEVTVPVHVAVIGFEPDVAEGLEARLDEERVRHAYGSWPRDAPPPDAGDPALPAKLHLLGAAGWEWAPMPIEPVADYRVHDASPALEDEVRRALQDALVQDTLEANPVEDALAERLPEHGIPVREGAPTLVLMHAANLLDRPKGEHDWIYRLPGGPLEDVRVFGERLPVLAMDASAEVDPWTFSPHEQQPTYGTPRNASGDQAVDALEQAVHDATHVRLLQGTFYAVEPAPCHAVTLLLADRPSSPAGERADPTEHLDLARLQAEIDEITGPPLVHLDVEVLHLPEDDPALAQATRGSYAERDGLRAWLDENWSTYWNERAGCEAYLMLAMVTHSGEFEAIAIHGEDEDRRIGLAFVPGTWSSVNHSMERLILHELGHLIGPAHPHGYVTWDGGYTYPSDPGGGYSSRWSSIWSAASYQTGGGFEGGETVGLAFGVQDRANTLRSQVGFAYRAVHEAGLGDEPEVQQALADVERLDWAGALTHLVSLLHDAG